MKYPIVLIHGLYGYGEQDEAKHSELLPYWGYKGNDLATHLKNKGYEVFAPSLGPYNSAWDRACILWAYLFGGRVDFGEVHSIRYHHDRYGEEYPGVLKDLGKTKKHKKIELFGHSFGGATVKEVSSLFTQGDELERKTKDHSPLFDGGHGDLIHTVTTLSGVNNGTTAATLADRSGISLVTIYAIMMQSANECESQDQYDDMVEHWGKTGLGRAARYSSNVLDNIGWEMDVDTIQTKVNPKQVINPNTYYFAHRVYMPPREMDGACQYCGYIMALSGNFVGLKYSLDYQGWKRNDGFVNLVGQSAPLNQPHMDGYWSGTDFKPGIWYDMPAKHADHLYYCGHSGNVNDFYADMDRMLALYDKLG